MDKKEHKKALKNFALSYLRPDIVLVFKILSTNVNSLVVSELVKKLWDNYYQSLNWKKFDDENEYEEDQEDLEKNENSDDYSTLPKFPSNVNTKEEENEVLNEDVKAKTNFSKNGLKNNESKSSTSGSSNSGNRPVVTV